MVAGVADTEVQQAQSAKPAEVAAVVAAPRTQSATPAEPEVGQVVAQPVENARPADSADPSGAKDATQPEARPALPADGKKGSGDPDSVRPISAKDPGRTPPPSTGDWMKIVPPPGASPKTKLLIAQAEKAIRFAVDLLGREYTVTPPPEVSALLKTVKADNVGNGQMVEAYNKIADQSRQTKTALLSMDDKVAKTSTVMADEKSKNLAAIKTIVSELKDGLRPYNLVKKLTAVQDYAVMQMVAQALRKICEKIVAAADYNWDIAHGKDGGNGGGGGGIPGGGAQQPGGGQGGGGDGGLGGLLGMLPMLGMIPMSLIPMLPMLHEMFAPEEPKNGEEKKPEGAPPPPPPPGEGKPPEGQAPPPSDAGKPAEGAAAPGDQKPNDPNKPAGEPAKSEESKAATA